MRITLDVTIVKIASKHLAIARPGGMDVRSSPCPTPEAAFRNLCWKLSGNGPTDDSAELAVALLMSGTDLETETKRQALPPAQTPQPTEDEAAAQWMRAHPDSTYQDYVEHVEASSSLDPWSAHSV